MTNTNSNKQTVTHKASSKSQAIALAQSQLQNINAKRTTGSKLFVDEGAMNGGCVDILFIMNEFGETLYRVSYP